MNGKQTENANLSCKNADRHAAFVVRRIIDLIADTTFRFIIGFFFESVQKHAIKNNEAIVSLILINYAHN